MFMWLLHKFVFRGVYLGKYVYSNGLIVSNVSCRFYVELISDSTELLSGMGLHYYTWE